jgi:hypothetical protein
VLSLVIFCFQIEKKRIICLLKLDKIKYPHHVDRYNINITRESRIARSYSASFRKPCYIANINKMATLRCTIVHTPK